MSNRKMTPDVLGDILGEVRDEVRAETPAPRPAAQAAPAPRPKAARTATPAPAKSADKVKPAPEAWEYLTVVLGDHHGLRPKSLNGQPLEQWKSQPIISDFLTIVGRYGWEMVGIVERGCGEMEAYFKRPQRE
jgi:hypothetical protein